MAKDRIRMPSSGGGLVRYFDEYRTKFEIKPQTVIGMIVVIIILISVLHLMKPLG